MTDAGTYCKEAAELVGGDRAKQHGPVARNFAHIAAFWTTWLRCKGLLASGAELEAHDVAMMMTLLKGARTLTGEHNPDDYRDGIGYLGLGAQIADEKKGPARGGA